MASSLDELKKQRALVQQHLAWLDQQIADQSKGAAQPSNESPQTSEREKLKLVGSKPTVAPSSTPPRVETRHPFPEIGESKEMSSGVQPSQVHGDIAKAKVGCVVLFVGAVGLFLFLLFGLPYLIDDSDDTQTSEESVESVED